jgi:hypothetical protein
LVSNEVENQVLFGTPFLRAFHIIVDYDDNRIGFANKRLNFGSEIVGERAPGNPRPWYRFSKEDEPLKVPQLELKPDPTPLKNDTTAPATPTSISTSKPSTDDQYKGIIQDDKPLKPKNKGQWIPKPSQPSGDEASKDFMMVGFSIFIILLVMMVLVFFIHKKRKARLNAGSTFDDNFDPPLLH